MVRKSSTCLVILISMLVIAFLVNGCAKKQVVKEEAAGKPYVEGKKETPKVEALKVMEPPKVAPTPSPAKPTKEEPKMEAKKEAAAKPEEKPAPFDLTGMRLHFAFDDYSLSSQSKENLDKIASWVKKNSDTKIQIEGHTCDIGTAEYNLALGDRRANSSKKYLEGLGVDPDRLSTISYGEERPRFPNTDEAHRSMNRRDEFVLVK